MSNKTFVDSRLRTSLGAALLALTWSGPALASGETLAIDAFDLAPGASVVIEFEVQIDNPTTPGATQVCNQGAVPSEDFGGSPIAAVPSDDPATGAAGDTTCTQLLLQADLSISKGDSADPVDAAAAFSYSLDVTNAGPSVATGVSVVDTLPAGVGFVGASGTGWSCMFSAPTVTCTRPSLAIAAAPTITVNVTAPAEGGMISNSVTVSANEMDPVPGNNSDTETTTITPRADISVTKTDGVATAVPGQSVVYTIVVSNGGPSTAPSVSVSDTFPGVLSCGWTSVAAGGATGNTNNAGPANLANTLNMPPASSVTYTATCAIASSATGTLANTASVGSSIADPVSGNDSATDTDTLTPQADVAVTKTDGVASATPGGQVTYTIVVSNGGPSNDPSVSVADTFPASLSCGWTSVAAGGATGNSNNAGPANLSDTLSMPASSSVTYTATCDVDPDAVGTLSNTVTATASVTDPNGGNNSATDNDSLAPEADLAITKTDGVTSAVPGEQLVYTIVVSNGGPSTDANATVADTFPGTLSCGWTSVAAGGATGNTNNAGPADLSDTLSLPPSGSVTYTVTCDIAPGATGTLSNTATVTASATDPVPGNNSATDNDTALAAEADLAISKTDGVSSAVPGEQVVYTIVASNAGPSTDPSASVADTFPGTLSCGWTSVAAGSATGNTNNAGPANLADTLSLPPGGSVTYTVTCDVDPGATGTLSNTATITASVTDPSAGNNSATDNDNLVPEADLSVTKTDGSATAVPGATTIYTIVVSNGGPSADPSVSVTDAFPGILSCGWTSVAAGGATGNSNNAGPANLGDTLAMPAGSSVTYTATCSIAADATGSLANTATVAGSVTDPVPGNNSATDTDTLTPEADVSITKTDGVSDAVPGLQVAYTIVASNAGPSTATGVTVSDTFPASLSCAWTSSAAGGATGNDAGASGDINDSAITLPPGGSVTYAATCDVSSSATGTLSNTATVSTAVTDPSPGNNSATDTDNLVPGADVSITKTDGVSSVVPGTQVVYTIVVANASGPSTATGVTVSDTFPGVVTCTWTSLGSGGATGDDGAGSGDISDNGITLPPSSSVTYTVTCDVDPSATGMLSNTASVTSAVTDPMPGNDTATDTDTLTPEADLEVIKTAAPPTGPLTGGQGLVYTITVVNHGPSTSTAVVVTDALPTGVNTPVTAGDCTEASPAVPTCTLGTVLPGMVNAKSYTLSVIVDTPPPATITNTATVASGVTDPIAGNDSDTVIHTNDLVPPTVVAIDTVAGDGSLEACDTVRKVVTAITITFSEELKASGGVPGPGDADNPDSYLLLATGPDLDFSTLGCGAPQGDDVQVAIQSVDYATDTPSAPQSQATLHLATPLADGLYRFFACASGLQDLGGNELDGNGDASAGDDFEVDLFRIDRDNLLDNGHFDCNLDPWTQTPPASWVHDPTADATGSPLSGSAQIPSTNGTSFALDQCVAFGAFPPSLPFEMSLRFQLNAPASTAVGLIFGCTFFTDGACAGPPVPAGVRIEAAIVTGATGVWSAERSFSFTRPASGASARCGVSVENPPHKTFSARTDAVVLEALDEIFSDGFESGDTTAWSATTP